MYDIQLQGQNLEDSSKPGLFLLYYIFNIMIRVQLTSQLFYDYYHSFWKKNKELMG